jgi:hypothetical protein
LLNVPPPSLAGQLPQWGVFHLREPDPNVGASLLAMMIDQAKKVFARNIKRRGTS